MKTETETEPTDYTDIFKVEIINVQHNKHMTPEEKQIKIRELQTLINNKN
ncbi:MAG: hypothetical protein H7096_11270 [Flavobacterium sp.]|nr:hypothetical protein [Pedobacter sp.]